MYTVRNKHIMPWKLASKLNVNIPSHVQSGLVFVVTIASYVLSLIRSCANIPFELSAQRMIVKQTAIYLGDCFVKGNLRTVYVSGI
jgi:hypothetical protein